MHRLLVLWLVVTVYLPIAAFSPDGDAVAPIAGHYRVLPTNEWFQVVCLHGGAIVVDVVNGGYAMVRCRE